VTVNPNPVVTVNNTSICAGGTATLTAGGATSYAWNTGSTTNPLTVSPGATTTYTVTGTSLGCTGTGTGVVTVNANPTVSVTGTDEHCGHADGTVTATPNGGSSPYTYLWNTGGTTQSLTGLTANTYSVTVTDNNGCTGTGSVTITNIAGPSAPFGTIVNETCTQQNGSVTVSPVNGTPPYTYLWSNGGTTATINNLSAGTYGVTVTDGNGCTASNSTTITDSPGPSLAQDVITPANCGSADGGATITVTGGTSPYTYQWSNGQTGQNLTNVTGGQYSVTITDANGCDATLSVTIPTLGGPSAYATGTDATCDRNNGTATATGTGGTGTYTYQWNNGQTTQTAINLGPGTYTVTVDDGNCYVTASVTIGNIPGPTAAFSVTPQSTTIDDPLFTFTDESLGASLWYWDFGDGSTSSTQHPTHSYDASGTYVVTLTVENAAGCRDSTLQEVVIRDNFVIWVPNAFSPNNDGFNDDFGPKGVGIQPDGYEFYVFNRWGEVLFYTTDVNMSWDGTVNGKVIQQGVYPWLIILKDVNNINHKFDGHVNILK
jgi:gliding motility-associated-like protein